MLIRGVWVIDQSGLCLFQRSYGVPFIDKDQFAGMFTALFHFSTEITGQDLREPSLKRLEQFKWDKYYFTVHTEKGFNFLICTEGTGTPPSELFENIETAFFSVFKDQLILLSDLLQNARATRNEKHRLSQLIDQIVRVDAQEKIPYRTVSLPDVYAQKGKIRNLGKNKAGLEAIAILLHSSGSTSIKEIADLTKIKETRVRKLLGKLKKEGLIKYLENDRRDPDNNVRL